MYGKTYMGTVRATYLIDENFQIIKVFEKASPANNASEILKYFQISDTAEGACLCCASACHIFRIKIKHDTLAFKFESQSLNNSTP